MSNWNNFSEVNPHGDNGASGTAIRNPSEPLTSEYDLSSANRPRSWKTASESQDFKTFMAVRQSHCR